jgi:hypothetical protein
MRGMASAVSPFLCGSQQSLSAAEMTKKNFQIRFICGYMSRFLARTPNNAQIFLALRSYPYL